MRRKERAQQEEKRALEKFQKDCDAFINDIYDILGWYDKIIKFAIPVINDIKTGTLKDTEQKFHEYRSMQQYLKKSALGCRLSYYDPTERLSVLLD